MNLLRRAASQLLSDTFMQKCYVAAQHTTTGTWDNKHFFFFGYSDLVVFGQKYITENYAHKITIIIIIIEFRPFFI
jgi:hypothetical protein